MDRNWIDWNPRNLLDFPEQKARRETCILLVLKMKTDHPETNIGFEEGATLVQILVVILNFFVTGYIILEMWAELLDLIFTGYNPSTALCQSCIDLVLQDLYRFILF